MALTDVSDGSRVVEFATMVVKVTLARACKAGDILGVAEDDFDDLGPAYADIAAHATAITYLPRLVAATAGKANEVITAYGAAYVGGVSSAAAFKKVYMAQTSGTAGQMTETIPTTTGHCSSIIGMSVATNRVFLFPGVGVPPDTIIS